MIVLLFKTCFTVKLYMSCLETMYFDITLFHPSHSCPSSCEGHNSSNLLVNSKLAFIVLLVQHCTAAVHICVCYFVILYIHYVLLNTLYVFSICCSTRKEQFLKYGDINTDTDIHVLVTLRVSLSNNR